MTSALRGRGLVKGDNSPLSYTPDRLRSWDLGVTTLTRGRVAKIPKYFANVMQKWPLKKVWLL